VQVVPFSEALMLAFRDHGDRTDRQKARLIWLVEKMGNEAFVKLMSQYMGGAEFGPEVHPNYSDEWKRRDVLGVHAQKQEGLSWVRARRDARAARGLRRSASAALKLCSLTHAYVAASLSRGLCDQRSFHCATPTSLDRRGGTQVGACVPAGRLQTEDFDAIADVADKYSNGEVRITCEENILFPNVKNEDVEAMKKEPLFERFEIDAGNVMRGLVSCTGSQFCGFALIETKNRCAPRPAAWPWLRHM
jgi:sulfite reductase beta subunit-like hemoprotein